MVRRIQFPANTTAPEINMDAVTDQSAEMLTIWDHEYAAAAYILGLCCVFCALQRIISLQNGLHRHTRRAPRANQISLTTRRVGWVVVVICFGWAI